MLGPDEQHLTEDQLDRLSGTADSEESDYRNLLASSHNHLVVCPQCEQRLKALVDFNRRLASARAVIPAETGQDCPEAIEWTHLAVGLATQLDGKYLMHHAATCDHCGSLLRQALEDLELPTTSEENSLLNSLATTRPGWQKQMARRLSSSSSSADTAPQVRVFWQRYLRLYPYMGLAAALVAVAIASIWFLDSRSPARADRLLAEAYTQRRTMELRISGAKYAPLRVERAGSSFTLARPVPLLDAEALIARNIVAHGNDVRWLQAKGRAELLDGNAEAAIKTLQHATELAPDSSSALIDLACAFFLRGQALDRPADYGESANLLGKILSRSPDDPVALFNHAISLEQLFLYAQAVEDWEHYLRIDPIGDWSGEARRHLDDLRKRLQELERKSSELLLPPAELVSPHPGILPTPAVIIHNQFEEYLRTATRDWLPDVFSQKKTGSRQADRQSTYRVLRVLADIASVEHNDSWLKDFLAQSRNSREGLGTQFLAMALVENELGDFSKAGQSANKAADLFRQEGNDAGALRAQLEQIYALHLSEEGQHCAYSANVLSQALTGRSYTWINTQLQLESAICEGMIGQLDKAQQLTQAALQLAQKNHYGVLYLRALALASNNDSSSGNYRSAWKRDVEALEQFWTGNYPSMRAYNIYSDLDTLADQAHQWHLQLAVWKQAIRVLPPDADRVLVAMAHSRLANAALMTDDTFLATAEFQKAAVLFHACPRSEATENNEAEAEIALARLELLRSDFDASLKRLRDVETRLPNISSRYVTISFYQTLGEVYLSRGENRQARKSLEKSVELSELALLSMHSQADRLAWQRETGSSYRSLVDSIYRTDSSENALAVWEWFHGSFVRQQRSVREARYAGTLRRPEKTLTTAASDLPTPETVAELKSLRSSLTNETIVSYFISSKGIIAWSADNEHIEMHFVPVSRKSFDSLAFRFAQLCSDPNSNKADLSEDGRQLYNILVAPIFGSLPPGRRIVIEPDGPVSVVPFQALVDPTGRYLADRFTFVWSPGIYVLRATRPPQTIDPGYPALIVASQGPSGLPSYDIQPLPDLLVETRSIAAKFRNPRVLLGRSASPSSVQESISNATLFHFAGHAVSTPDDVRLLFGDDALSTESNFLTASSFRPGSLRKIALAVFSACSTEKTNEGNFYGPDSIVMTFLAAGVPNVVATRWNVDSASTGEFMNRFYDHMISGLSVADALRVAGNEFRRDPARSHPFYWAGFNVFGRG